MATTALSQTELAAFLSTQFETQRIEIFDKENKAHQVELPTSALRLLVDILGEVSISIPLRWCRSTPSSPLKKRPMCSTSLGLIW